MTNCNCDGRKCCTTKQLLDDARRSFVEVEDRMKDEEISSIDLVTEFSTRWPTPARTHKSEKWGGKNGRMVAHVRVTRPISHAYFANKTTYPIHLITFNGHLDNMSLSTALKPFHPWRTNKVIWIHESLNTFFNRLAFRVITLQLKLYDTLWG